MYTQHSRTAALVSLLADKVLTLIQVLLHASVHTTVQLPAHWGCFELHMSSGFWEPPQLLGRQPLKTWKHLPCVMVPAEVPLARN